MLCSWGLFELSRRRLGTLLAARGGLPGALLGCPRGEAQKPLKIGGPHLATPPLCQVDFVCFYIDFGRCLEGLDGWPAGPREVFFGWFVCMYVRVRM